MVGAGLGGETDEVRDVLLGHFASQLVRDGHGFPGTGGSHIQHLQMQRKHCKAARLKAKARKGTSKPVQ